MFAKLLANFRNTMIVSVLLALVMIVSYYFDSRSAGVDTQVFMVAVFRWMHVFFGILWIGLLYYFNFVQIRVMPSIPAELKPAVSKHIAPEALFWFRWAAVATVVMGLAIAGSRGYFVQVITLDATEGFTNKGFVLLGVGMWLGIIMMLNVWGVIWPNQKIALGIKDGDADAKAKAGKIAMLGSRTNLLLSLPMLTAMTMHQTIFN
jgi:uncharacterized membrane protein